MTVMATAAACSSDDEVQPQQGRVPISLTASVGSEETTRGYQEESLVEDEVVYVWGKEGSGSYDYLKAWTLTADGSNGWKSGYTHKYYPLSGETLTMVALHGNFSYTEGDALPTTISHSVETDQTVAGNYEKSDLLWATESGSNEDATGKSLAFTHKQSKIEIKLSPGEGYSDISSAEVKLRYVLPSITINPRNGELGTASGIATTIKARRTVNNLSDETTPYAIYEAIIPPQAAPVRFLNIKIGDKVATVDAGVTTFESNRRYFYDITITDNYISVAPNISKWGGSDTPESSVSETAVLGDPGVAIENISYSHKGYFIASNNKIYATRSEAIARSGNEPYAVIAFVGKVNYYFDKFLAIACEDAQPQNLNGWVWNSTSSDAYIWAQNHPITINSTTYNTINPLTGYDAVSNNKTVSSQTRTAAATKGWRVPSVTDWRNVFASFCSQASASYGIADGQYNNIEENEGSILKEAIMNATGFNNLHGHYWSSSTNGSNGSWAYMFEHNQWVIGTIVGNSNPKVRLVFAY